jgi:undecaprenyl-diphosphatase
MNYIEAIIIAIVEGITEFLPISSTGHMIITQKLLGIPSSEFVNLFTVNIQFGAILSVIILYWKRFFEPLTLKNILSDEAGQSASKKFMIRYDFYLKILFAFIPAMIFGLLFNNLIDKLLANVVVVAVSLVLGGIILVFVDQWFKNQPDNTEITYPKALKIGFFQVISMIPGVSRSAATIIGGLTQKLNRKAAAEFSFFLAVPTMFGASALELLKSYKSIQPDNIPVLLVGNLVAFIVAMVAIKGFISYLTKHGFKIFGYYRIIVGVVILILWMLGINLNIVG